MRTHGDGSCLYRHRNFTLVELLVMIAVICIIAALLLPALQKTLITARLVSCANNQQHLFVGITLYGDDNRQHLPAPWPLGYANLFRDLGYTDNPLLPMGLAVLYRDNYLDDGFVVSCTDNDAGGYAAATNPTNVALQMEQIRQTGLCLPISSGNVAHRYTYALFPGLANIPGGESAVKNHHSAWTWPLPDYYNPSTVGARLPDNLPGGRNVRPGFAVSRIRSPRPYLACYFPESSTNFRPHQLSSFNALYADGKIIRIPLTDGICGAMKLQSLKGVFGSVIIPRYPQYRPPVTQ